MYGLLDVVVQASSTFPEGLSRVVMEAMAFGKPVVATAIVGNREAVVDGVTGRLVPPADPGAMAEAVAAVLRDPQTAARYAAEGRRRAEALFSLEAHAGAMTKLYEELAA